MRTLTFEDGYKREKNLNKFSLPPAAQKASWSWTLRRIMFSRTEAMCLNCSDCCLPHQAASRKKGPSWAAHRLVKGYILMQSLMISWSMVLRSCNVPVRHLVFVTHNFYLFVFISPVFACNHSRVIVCETFEVITSIKTTNKKIMSLCQPEAWLP